MAVSTVTSPFLFNIINHLKCKKFNKDYHWHTVNLYSVRNFTRFILHLWLQNQRDSITSSIHPMLSTKLKPGFNLEKRVMWTIRYHMCVTDSMSAPQQHRYRHLPWVTVMAVLLYKLHWNRPWKTRDELLWQSKEFSCDLNFITQLRIAVISR